MSIGYPVLQVISSLFDNYHSFRGLKVTCVQALEIHSTGNGLSDLVSAVPIEGGFLVLIAARSLYPQIQLMHKLPLDIVDAKGHFCISG